MKRMHKKVIILLVVFSVLAFSSLALALDFEPNTTIPNSKFVKNAKITVSDNMIGEYISSLYKFFVGISGIVAVIMIAFGGIQWLFSGGSSDKISSAKETIVGAIMGLLLAVGSYLILYTINPDLVVFRLDVADITLDTLPSEGVACPRSVFTEQKQSYQDCGEIWQENTNNDILNNLGGCYFTRCPKDEICFKSGSTYGCEKFFAVLDQNDEEVKVIKAKIGDNYAASCGSKVARESLDFTALGTMNIISPSIPYYNFQVNTVWGIGTWCGESSQEYSYCYIDFDQGIYWSEVDNPDYIKLNGIRCAE